MIVETRYPAPVAFTPRRGRTERFGFVACLGPAEIREEDLARSVDAGPTFPDKKGAEQEPLRLLDGRLWTPVCAREPRAPNRPARAEEFLAWLAGKGDLDLGLAFQRLFSGTPLVALGTDDRANALMLSRGVETRGEPIDLSGARALTLDGREKAVADVARYLSEEVILLDGEPYMRASPVLLVNGVLPELSFRVASRLWPDHPGLRAFPATPKTLAAAIEVQRDMGSIPVAGAVETTRRWAEAVPESALEGDVVRLLVNAFAEPLRRSLDDALTAAGHLRSREGLTAARDAMRAVEIPAMTGTAHLDGAAPVLAMRQAIRTWMTRPRQGSHGQEHLAAFLDRVVIPGLDAAIPDDVDALARLAP